MEGEDREDLVAVDHLAVRIDGKHPVAVAVERDAEVETVALDELLQGAKIGGAAAHVDVRSVGFVADRRHLRAQLLEGLRRKARVGAVGAVDPESQPTEVGAEPLEDVLQVAVGRDADLVDLAAARRRRV
jgi:hypothetical protein